MTVRSPQSCAHRRPAHSANQVECAVIRALVGRDLPDAPLVDMDACVACCRTFLPTADDLNPVVASLIWSRTNSALANLDFTNDLVRRESLELVNEQVEKSIPLLLPAEEDLPLQPLFSSSDSISGTDRLHKAVPSLTTHGLQMGNWAVGVTTAARRLPTLHRSLASLNAVGWKTPHLFVDGQLELPESASMFQVSRRDEALGAWQNFYHSLKELHAIQEAEYLMLVQDDAWWPSHLPIREYLEQIHWPVSDRFIVSAYCSSLDVAATNGWRSYEGIWKYGAVAMIFSRTAAAEFLQDGRICGYGPQQKGGIDTIIGEWAHRNHVPVFVPTPSLVQHIGDVSTLWKTSRAVGMRRASRFIGDEILPEANG